MLWGRKLIAVIAFVVLLATIPSVLLIFHVVPAPAGEDVSLAALDVCSNYLAGPANMVLVVAGCFLFAFSLPISGNVAEPEFSPYQPVFINSIERPPLG